MDSVEKVLVSDWRVIVISSLYYSFNNIINWYPRTNEINGRKPVIIINNNNMVMQLRFQIIEQMLGNKMILIISSAIIRTRLRVVLTDNRKRGNLIYFPSNEFI